jgi:hypothetical protein
MDPKFQTIPAPAATPDPEILRRALNEAVVHMLALAGIVEDTIENDGRLDDTGPAENRIEKVEAFITLLTRHTAIVFADTLTGRPECNSP